MMPDRDFREAIVEAVSVARKAQDGAQIPDNQGTQHGESHQFQNLEAGQPSGR